MGGWTFSSNAQGTTVPKCASSPLLAGGWINPSVQGKRGPTPSPRRIYLLLNRRQSKICHCESTFDTDPPSCCPCPQPHSNILHTTQKGLFPISIAVCLPEYFHVVFCAIEKSQVHELIYSSSSHVMSVQKYTRSSLPRKVIERKQLFSM